LEPPEKPVEPAPAVVAEPSGGEEPEVPRILIADENASLRKILRHMVSALGWEAIEAQDGQQVLQQARSTPAPHAILLDLAIPKLSGFEVCQRLKSDDRCQLIPIVAITAEDSPELKLKALEAGADDFLIKPVSRAELTARLRSLLRIQRFNQELIGAESVAMALARAVAAKDGYAHRHVEEVANWAVILGKSLELDATELKMLRYGAILHNVGKIGIPDAVLEKTGALTPREMALFQQHPRVGCDICAPLKPLKPVLPIIRHHKERWDGTGYPDGLRGPEIPLGAQIVGVVNVYTALTSNRPYRKAISREQAIAHLRQQAAGGAHNPELVERFIECLMQAGNAPPQAPLTSQDVEPVAE
jgi:putative two-component system response regulator